MTLTSKNRAALRAEAHTLVAAVHIGRQGLTPTVLQTLLDTLRTRELVKVQFTKAFESKPKEAANEIAQSVGAEVVQVIGRTVTIYRENPELWTTNVVTPPWRR
jgi:RNA-binding protein